MIISRTESSPRSLAPRRAGAPTGPRDTFLATGETPPAQLQQLRQLALTRHTRPADRTQALLETTLQPRATDSPEAAQVRREAREVYEATQKALEAARAVAARGPGRRPLPGGGWETVQKLPHGATEVSVTDAQGRTRTTRFNEHGRVHVVGPAGTLDRDGAKVSRNGSFYDATEDGRLVRGAPEPGGGTRFTIVAPDGTVSYGPPPGPQDPVELARARANSEIPGLHGSLADLRDPQGRPLTGEGVTIGLLDDADEFLARRGPHGTRVGNVANGVAPGAETKDYSAVRGGTLESAARNGSLNPKLPADLADDPAALDRAMRESPSRLVDLVTDRLGQILDDPGRDPKLRVLNLTLGSVRSQHYDALWNLLNDGKHPTLRQEVLGDLNGATDLTPEVRKRIAAYADQRLNDPQSAYSQSMERYREATRRAEEQGIAVVVSASNAGPHHQAWDQASPGSSLSDFARSPHVISVGASNPNGRPGRGNRGQHTPWEMTAAGDGPGGFNPTLLAHGQDVQVMENEAGSGTSVSSPFVSGTIALMLQANPNLTVADIRRILQETSTPLQGVDPRVQGAGVINPEDAVRRARG